MAANKPKNANQEKATGGYRERGQVTAEEATGHRKTEEKNHGRELTEKTRIKERPQEVIEDREQVTAEEAAGHRKTEEKNHGRE